MKPLFVPFGLALGLVAATPVMAKPVVKPTTAAPVLLAPSGTYRVDPDHSSIVFRVKHLGLVWFTARFTSFSADLGFNADAPEKSTLSVSIDPTSIQTGVAPKPTENFDNKLASDSSWFNSSAFPRMTFVAKRIDRTGPATAIITGDMTIRGVTRPLVLATVFNGSLKAHPFSKRPLLGFSATGTLKRSDYGMSALIPMVGDEVKIAVEAELVTK